MHRRLSIRRCPSWLGALFASVASAIFLSSGLLRRTSFSRAATPTKNSSLMPRDASPTRLVNRCKVSGRRRAYIRRFGMSRMTFREHAMMGLIPGVTKSSW